jgi:hypothetical protein
VRDGFCLGWAMVGHRWGARPLLFGVNRSDGNSVAIRGVGVTVAPTERTGETDDRAIVV